MMPGFIEVVHHRFYGEIWPRIENRVTAIRSNWKAVHKALKAKLPHEPLLIYWGYKDVVTNQKVVLAITHSNHSDHEQHWIAPELDT
jgi:hypothetical protein